MIAQVLWALMAVVLSIGACWLYFAGSNILIDTWARQRVLSQRRHSQVQPWLFLFPALFLLALFLVYPVIKTFYLSFFDGNGETFRGWDNYLWALSDPQFLSTIKNNLAWLIIVPALSTGFGLLIAALADRVWWGALAKSLIFMPMAISFVGASVIWKFVYHYRGPDVEQIGGLNALVMAFGLEPQAWITLQPWNNLFLMAILVWVQTGFAMVILGAALRGVPTDTLEAARIDGANPIQVFFRIVLPQIKTTIIVVWTTITIVVLKVFDIVQAMTNGLWDTQVLANLMYDWMFRGGGDEGRSSVIAVFIMIAVLPVMIYNYRRMRAEENL